MGCLTVFLDMMVDRFLVERVAQGDELLFLPLEVAFDGVVLDAQVVELLFLALPSLLLLRDDTCCQRGGQLFFPSLRDFHLLVVLRLLGGHALPEPLEILLHILDHGVALL
eukprot:15580453-Heterocapsa_arctica.AAC.1